VARKKICLEDHTRARIDRVNGADFQAPPVLMRHGVQKRIKIIGNLSCLQTAPLPRRLSSSHGQLF
jgi:hypothetical protein